MQPKMPHIVSPGMPIIFEWIYGNSENSYAFVSLPRIMQMLEVFFPGLTEIADESLPLWPDSSAPWSILSYGESGLIAQMGEILSEEPVFIHPTARIGDNVEIEGIDFSSSDVKSYVDFNTLSGDGTIVGSFRRLTDIDQLITSSVTDVRKASDHLSQQRAFLGAQINKAELQKDALDQRIIATSEKISDIDTADMAALVTRLQSLLLNKDAAQQAYAKIGQNSLFDYLK